jgi:UDP-N-acetylmuramoylalanine--D-glutamate ligase
MKALVMGLGLHGGGVQSARYLAERGAEVTVTDLRDAAALAPSLERLSDLPIRYVLGRHDRRDFENADLVVKNPGVTPDSPFLKHGKQIETDISLFLAASPARLTAVTGTKGKSTTASAIHFVMEEARKQGIPWGKAYLGGNITRSPLSFLSELGAGDDVVLELSSWQLGDLRGRGLLKPRAAVITAMLPDHLDRYGTMEAYAADKKVVYAEQDPQDLTVAHDDLWGKRFLGETPARNLVCAAAPLPPDVAGGWLTGHEGPALVRLQPDAAVIEAVGPRPCIAGYHQKRNLLAASLCLLDLGIPPAAVRECLDRFPGIPHRLEFFLEARGVRFYNDTAATIPEAAAAAIGAFGKPPVVVAGGADKNLDLRVLADAARGAKALVLLAGAASAKLARMLEERGIPYAGPFDTVDGAVAASLAAASAGDVVVLSPGCASFGMFLNEFDRGRRWKEAVLRLA